MKYLLLFVAGYLLTRAILSPGLKLMIRFGLTAKNYLGEPIPMPAGLIPAGVFLFVAAVTGFWFHRSEVWPVLSFCLVLICLGIVDDLKGSPAHKGFRGHFKALSQGKITTGMAKAALGGLLALMAAWFLGEQEIDHLVINTLLIALFTNLINLMDLRPGRAIKIFLIISILILWFGSDPRVYWLLPLTGAVLAYFPWDLKAKGMLGDTGANLLGFSLGVAMVKVYGLPVKIIVLWTLMGIHFYAEKFSISALIEEKPWLSYLDKLGRRDFLGGDSAD